MIIHQSDLGAWSRCPAQFGYQRAGMPRKTTSALAYGSVMHHALHVLEDQVANGTNLIDALNIAIETFTTYWDPRNIEAICEKVAEDGWIRGQGYTELRMRGVAALRSYADLMRFEKMEVLGLEYSFMCPIENTWDEELGEPHILAGTVDRLAARFHKRVETLCVDDYKGLARDTEIPTPTGWTTMGAVEVGDEIFGADGSPCRVIGKSEIHDRPCYRVTFDDGSSVVADNVHLWATLRGRHCEPTVIDVEDLRLDLVDDRGQRHHRVQNAAALHLPEVDLPVDPYVLGCWIGDGKRSSGELTTGDAEQWDLIKECGYGVGSSPGITRTILGLRRQLIDAGYLGHKQIPDVYLRASMDQRLALLQGLCDTDGSWHRRRHQVQFVSVDKGLATSVRELALSLGAKARLWEYQACGFGIVRTAYRVTFSPTDFNPFRLSRKASLVRPGMTNARRRIVVSVEPTLRVPTQCIMVDSPDHLYLCGESMIPTHNTGKTQYHLQHNLQFTAYLWATTKPEFWLGWRGEEGFGEARGAQLFERFAETPRRAFWINLKDLKVQDAGFRNEIHYRRFILAVNQVTASVTADIFPLTISGEACTYCEYRDVCGGLPVPSEDYDPTLEVLGA
jgi:hypothetical protein